MNKVIFEKNLHKYYSDEDHSKEIPGFSYIHSQVFPKPFFKSTDALKKGQAVHQATQLLDEGDLGELPEWLEPYMDDWIEFKMAYGIRRFDWIEKPLASYDYWFASTPDRISGDTVIEIKTGNKYPSHKLQTANHQILWEENTGYKINERLVVYLTGRGPKVVEHRDASDLITWKSAVTIFHYRRKTYGT